MPDLWHPPHKHEYHSMKHAVASPLLYIRLSHCCLLPSHSNRRPHRRCRHLRLRVPEGRAPLRSTALLGSWKKTHDQHGCAEIRSPFHTNIHASNYRDSMKSVDYTRQACARMANDATGSILLNCPSKLLHSLLARRK